jgi:lipopolysaccharide transport system ATP-binding protein
MQPLLTIENLGKRYVIRHEQRERYQAFRDVMADTAKNIVKRLAGTKNEAGNKEEFWALKDVSLTINQGEKVGIIGRNGAGKSTLLKILSRITVPTSGRIRLRGRVASLLEVGTGFHPELSGRENIYLNGAILGMAREEIKRKFDEIVAFSEIEQFLDTPVKRYSSGMYVRLAFAVAAHLDSEILLMDEVLAVGDVNFQKKCLGKMEEISKKQGRTVLFVSHQMNAVEKLCNRGIVLDRGIKKFESENVREVVKYYLSGGTRSFEKPTLWENPGELYNNQFFKPLRFYLTDAEGRVLCLPVANDEDIFVNIECEIRQLDAALTIAYYVVDEDSRVLYCSNQIDMREDDWPKLHTGKNHLRTRVPKRFLNEGDYRLFIDSSIHQQRFIVPPDTDNINIYLSIKGGLSDSPYWTYKRQGVVAPVLKWTLVE